MTNATTLVEFLRARLDEREKLARAASGGGGRWSYPGSDSVAGWSLYDEEWRIASMATYDTKSYDYSARMPGARNPSYIDPDANGEHIAANDPATVLADVEAKRRIVAVYAEVQQWDSEYADEEYAEGRAVGLGEAVRILALPYADHPDYDPSWRPAEVTA